MLGAIVGDIVGSIYEFNNHKSKDFPLFQDSCFFTDDTVLTLAIAEWLMSNRETPSSHLAAMTARYPYMSYGARFRGWMNSPGYEPYNSLGNGSAMRVSPVAWWGQYEQEVLDLARASAEVTHNHPEGIKGAQAAALATFMAIMNWGPWDIRARMQEQFGYDMDRSVDQIREVYQYNETCPETVPEALICALEATDFEDAIRNAISIGGDSDTVAAITGSVAEALFGIPDWIAEEALSRLDDYCLGIIERFSPHCELSFADAEALGQSPDQSTTEPV